MTSSGPDRHRRPSSGLTRGSGDPCPTRENPARSKRRWPVALLLPRSEGHARLVQPRRGRPQIRLIGGARQPRLETLTERQALSVTISSAGPCDRGSPFRRLAESRPQIPRVAWTSDRHRVPIDGCLKVNRTTPDRALRRHGHLSSALQQCPSSNPLTSPSTLRLGAASVLDR